MKLASSFFGPFPIVDRVGPLAYKLQLPEGALIHLTFHVSQLKQVLKPSEILLDKLPIQKSSENLAPITKQILNERILATGGRKCKEILVYWDGIDQSEATWIPIFKFNRLYPVLVLWTRLIQPGENDTHMGMHGLDVVTLHENCSLAGDELFKPYLLL